MRVPNMLLDVHLEYFKVQITKKAITFDPRVMTIFKIFFIEKH